MMRKLAAAIAARIAITAPVRCEPIRVRSARNAVPAMMNSIAIRAKSLSALNEHHWKNQLRQSPSTVVWKGEFFHILHARDKVSLTAAYGLRVRNQ